jgi:hypothetical protein
MTELDTPLFIPPVDEELLVDSEEVATARLLHSPPRKRSRNLFEKSELMKVPIPQREASQIVRDEEFYLSDGSCIILVENTLFNVSPQVISQSQPLRRLIRCTEQSYQKIPLPSVPCFLCPRETNRLKASRMTTQSFSWEIPYHSFETSSGRYMLCEFNKLVLAFRD